MKRLLGSLPLVASLLLAPTAHAVAPLGDSFTFIVPPANKGAEFASVYLWLHNPNPRNGGLGDATYYIVAEELEGDSPICSQFFIQPMNVTNTFDCGITACPFGCMVPVTLPEATTQQLFVLMPQSFGQAVRVTITYSISGAIGPPPSYVNVPGFTPAFVLGSLNHLQGEVAFSSGSQQGWDDIDFLVRDTLR